MRKKSFVPLFAVAFVVAIVSTGIFYGLFVGRLRSASTSESSATTVMVAARNLSRGTVLKAADVKPMRWSGPLALTGVVLDAKQVDGLTVVEQILENEPVTQARLASKGKTGGGSMGIPSGMRAVSIHVFDSSGVLALLQPGHKIDVQVTGSASNPNGAAVDTQLRTVLQDMEVLSVEKQPDLSGRTPAPVVTLLATPKESGILGLADSSARIRVALRNPLDSERADLPTLGWSSLFRNGSAVDPGPAQRRAPVAPAVTKAPIRQPEITKIESRQVQLWVRIAGAGEKAMKEINTQLADGTNPTGSLQVSAFRPGPNADKALELLEENKLLEVLSASRLTAANHNPVSLQAGTQWNTQPEVYGLSIEFATSIQQGGRLRLRVNPEVTSPLDGAVSKRRIETEVEVADGQSFLVRGLIAPRDIPMLWNRLFPGREKTTPERELVVFVTPKVMPPDQAAGKSE